jgi:hypothetical protein
MKFSHRLCEMKLGRAPIAMGTAINQVADAAARYRVAAVWGVEPSMYPGLRIPDMFDAAIDGRVRVLCVMGEDRPCSAGFRRGQGRTHRAVRPHVTTNSLSPILLRGHLDRP